MTSRTDTGGATRWDPLSAALACSGWVAIAASQLVSGNPIRVVVVFGFVSLCPGLALVRNLGRSDPLEEVVVGLALSMSLAVVLTVGMAVGHWWHPGVALAILAVITTAAAARTRTTRNHGASLQEGNSP